MTFNLLGEYKVRVSSTLRCCQQPRYHIYLSNAPVPSKIRRSSASGEIGVMICMDSVSPIKVLGRSVVRQCDGSHADWQIDERPMRFGQSGP